MLIGLWWGVKGDALHQTNTRAAGFVSGAGTAENLPTSFD
jgi:hypothetical protein